MLTGGSAFSLPVIKSCTFILNSNGIRFILVITCLFTMHKHGVGQHEHQRVVWSSHRVEQQLSAAADFKVQCQNVSRSPTDSISTAVLYCCIYLT